MTFREKIGEPGVDHIVARLNEALAAEGGAGIIIIVNGQITDAYHGIHADHVMSRTE